MAKNKAFVIQWSEWEEIPDGFGHGVEFHTDPSPQKATLVAFLDGYEWLRGKPKVVTIFIRKADDKCSATFLTEVKKQIEDALKSGKLRHGHLGGQLHAWFNA
jgi:hypothetical protein